MSDQLIHYLVASDVTDMVAEHIHGKDQEDAVMQFINEGNQYGYDRTFFEGTTVYIVPASKVVAWTVELYEPPPQEHEVRLHKGGSI